MQNQILNDDDAACFLVEAIAKQSQNKKWELTVDGKKVEGTFRAHQVPVNVTENDLNSLKILSDWLLSYHPEELLPIPC